MDFLLECIGFPPDHDFESLARLARLLGEPVAWRGPQGEHLRLDLGAGLDLRLDREDGTDVWSLYPHFQSAHRLRVAVDALERLPDSPYDVLLRGWANPPLGPRGDVSLDSYPLAAVLTDARRLPREVERGHVIAVSLAGFALEVERVGAGPQAATRPPLERAFADGGWIAPLGGDASPGGCVELCLRVRSVREIDNPVTHARVRLLEAEAPGRPLVLFASPWQLDGDGLRPPSPGAWIEGTFLLTGRIAGGLASPTGRLGRTFG